MAKTVNLRVSKTTRAMMFLPRLIRSPLKIMGVLLLTNTAMKEMSFSMRIWRKSRMRKTTTMMMMRASMKK